VKGARERGGGGGEKQKGEEAGREEKATLSPSHHHPLLLKANGGTATYFGYFISLQFTSANILSFRFAQLKCYVPIIHN
jgi:hypothetical protein